MSTHPFLDSHIHLWPASASNPAGHTWMTPSGPLTRQHSISDYVQQSKSRAAGFIYVETDRALPSAKRPPRNKYGTFEEADLLEYAKQPLAEIAFLRRIVEGEGADEGNPAPESEGLKGIVAWAPIEFGWNAVNLYLKEAERIAGERTWKKVKGFRCLLQGITDEEEFFELVYSENWLSGLEELSRGGYVFDIGVDQRSGGVWQLELANKMMNWVTGGGFKMKYVINHMGKPDFFGRLETTEKKQDFERWRKAIEEASSLPGVYMKVSGAFSEIEYQDEASPKSVDDLIDIMDPWLDVIFESFGPQKIMFGSDWPVCNVHGPKSKSWNSWYEVLKEIVIRKGLSEEEQARVWHGTAEEAYGVLI